MGRGNPVAVPHWELDSWLPLLDWHFQSFCRDGAQDPDDLVQDVRNRDRQLWLVVEDEVKAAMLTSIAKDRTNTLRVTHCAGKGFRDWLHHFEAIKDWGRAMGCKRIEVTCRPGWEKFLGMKRTHVVLEGQL